MKKSLRLFFLGLMAMVSFNAMAEDIIWSEDFSSYSAGDVPTGGTYNYACVDGASATKIYDEELAGGTKPELLIGKTGSGKTGSFTVTIPLNEKNGEFFLSYMANYDRATVSVEGGTLGEKANSGNSYTYPVTVAAGTESITIKFVNENKSNVRLDDVKFYQGEAKKPAGLSWGKASTVVTFDESYELIPTLQNENNLPVTCTSSDENVCTVTNEGVITVVGAGVTTIIAEFEGNDEYEAQTVSITITVKPAIDDDAKGQKNNPYLITDEDFLTLVGDLNNSETKPKSGTIYVKGYITNIEEVSTEHGNATFKIAAAKDTDAEIKLKAYRAKYLEKKDFTSEDQIAVFDEVVVCGQIQWYYPEGENAEPEFIQGCYIYSQNGNTDGISSIKTTQKNGATYDLSGRRVEKAVKGIYIKDGKKVIF